MPKLTPPPRKDDPRFDDWLREMYARLVAVTGGEEAPATPAELISGGSTVLHFHSADRARQNHTGTQLSSTISDLSSFVLGLISTMGAQGHSNLSGLAWTSSSHTGTASTVAGFNGSGAAEYLTRTGTGTVVAMSAAPALTGNVTVAGMVEITDNTGNAFTLRRTSATARAYTQLIGGSGEWILYDATAGVIRLTISSGGDYTIPAASVTWSGNPTHSGNHTFSGDLTVGGDVVLGSVPPDTLTVATNAVTWSGNPTHSGNHIFSGNLTVQGDTVIGNASGDSLTVAPNAVTWSNNPTHSGNHTYSGVVTFGDDAVLSTTDPIRRSVDNSLLTLQGGSTAGDGAIIKLYGTTHATLPDIISFECGGGSEAAQFSATQQVFRGDISAANLSSGTYTPSLTNTTNIGSSTSAACQYSRVGDMVTVSGTVQVDATTSGSSCSLGISLPIASNFASSIQASGTCCQEALPASGYIIANAVADRVDAIFLAGTAAASDLHFIFTYRVI